MSDYAKDSARAIKGIGEALDAIEASKDLTWDQRSSSVFRAIGAISYHHAVLAGTVEQLMADANPLD